MFLNTQYKCYKTDKKDKEEKYKKFFNILRRTIKIKKVIKSNIKILIYT